MSKPVTAKPATRDIRAILELCRKCGVSELQLAPLGLSVKFHVNLPVDTEATGPAPAPDLPPVTEEEAAQAMRLGLTTDIENMKAVVRGAQFDPPLTEVSMRYLRAEEDGQAEQDELTSREISAHEDELADLAVTDPVAFEAILATGDLIDPVDTEGRSVSSDSMDPMDGGFNGGEA